MNRMNPDEIIYILERKIAKGGMAAISGSSTRDIISGVSRATKRKKTKKNLSHEKKETGSIRPCLYPLSLPFTFRE